MNMLAKRRTIMFAACASALPVSAKPLIRCIGTAYNSLMSETDAGIPALAAQMRASELSYDKYRRKLTGYTGGSMVTLEVEAVDPTLNRINRYYGRPDAAYQLACSLWWEEGSPDYAR